MSFYVTAMRALDAKDFEFKYRKCLFENQDICAYQHFVTNEKGGRLRVTNVMMLKEYKVHRATVIRVPEI